MAKTVRAILSDIYDALYDALRAQTLDWLDGDLPGDFCHVIHSGGLASFGRNTARQEGHAGAFAAHCGAMTPATCWSTGTTPSSKCIRYRHGTPFESTKANFWT